ncbi:type I-E CRISPR-associated protein Cas5/CasD [Streptomyces sp. NPDC097981]|uniref:type I-E CRISPR-associated protein Cas5/CasD n=1 Tax=Streptomyces sp. NPDC097981 TaxID=3155428 RepID=UPI0033268C20
MSGLLLHLSGPVQSWGSEAEFEVRTTYRWPTRSALAGLFACALGRPRGSDNRDLEELRYTIRVDRPGQREMDFHTVGGGYPRHLTPPTAEGKFRKAGEGTILTQRWYLTDAAFTVAVTGPAAVTEMVGKALRRPVFSLYLGRRSCTPDTPILLFDQVVDAVADLDRLPVHRATSRRGPRQAVTFIYDTAPEPGALPDGEVRDIPAGGTRSAFSRRPMWERQRELPGAPDSGLGTQWINALTAYRQEVTA